MPCYPNNQNKLLSEDLFSQNTKSSELKVTPAGVYVNNTVYSLHIYWMQERRRPASRVPLDTSTEVSRLSGPSSKNRRSSAEFLTDESKYKYALETA